MGLKHCYKRFVSTAIALLLVVSHAQSTLSATHLDGIDSTVPLTEESVADKSINNAADKPPSYTVEAAYLELRSGPARGYPIIFTLKYTTAFSIQSRKTQWLEIQTASGKQGWIHQQQLSRVKQDGKAVSYISIDNDSYRKKQWEVGFYTGGIYGGNNDNTPLIGFSGAWQFSQNYAAELTLNHVLGKFEESLLYHLDLNHTMAPEWPVSPTFNIGIGQIHSTPKSTLGGAEKNTSDTANFGIGFKYPIHHRFILRGDYNKHLIISGRNQLDSVTLWKLGISVYF